MPFQVLEKFLQVRRDGVSVSAEFPAQFVGNLIFGAVLLQEFEHARAHEIQPIHLAMDNFEDDSAVSVVC